MSKRTVNILNDELANSGPILRREVDAARKVILDTARQLSDTGEIQIGSTGDFI